MPRSIRVFSTESWSKGINLPKSSRKRFSLELTTYSERSLFPKEILTEINGSVFFFWRICEIKSGHLKHFSCAFTITCGNEWCMSPDKSIFIEEIMNSKGKETPYSKHRRKSISSWSQMSNGSKILKRMPFFLKRKGLICRSNKNNFARLKFKSLFRSLRFHEFPLHFDTASRRKFTDFIKVL